MDIQRDSPQNRRAYAIAAIVVAALLLAAMALMRLRPGATVVDRSALTFDTVTVGDMVRDVRAPGVLVSEHMRIIVATTSGRVEALPVRPGAAVDAGTTIVQLSNPDVQLAALQVQQQLTQSYAALAQLKSVHRQQDITQQGVIAQLRTQHLDAQRAAHVMDTMNEGRLASRNEVAAAHDRAEEMSTRYQLEQRRGAESRAADAEQVRLYQQQVAGLELIAREQRNRAVSMRITAGEPGELQSLGNPRLELGQWVNSGIELARVSQPGRLKAILRIPETLAKDVVIGQRATVDTRDGVVPGHVTSLDPVARGGSVIVEVALDGVLPKGARADLTIDGIIEVERLPGVMHVGRPAYGAMNTEVRLFKVIPNTGTAVRVNVQMGRTSVTAAEVRGGMSRGDSVIISDMSQYLTELRVVLRVVR